MLHNLQTLQRLNLEELSYDPGGSSAHFAANQNDPIVSRSHSNDLKSADLTEFGILETLRDAVATRTTACALDNIGSFLIDWRRRRTGAA